MADRAPRVRSPASAEGESAAEPRPGQTGERPDEKSDKAPKGAAKSGEDRDGKSAERGKDESGVRGEAADTKDRPGEKSAERQGKDDKSSTRGDKDEATSRIEGAKKIVRATASGRSLSHATRKRSEPISASTNQM